MQSVSDMGGGLKPIKLPPVPARVARHPIYLKFLAEIKVGAMNVQLCNFGCWILMRKQRIKDSGLQPVSTLAHNLCSDGVLLCSSSGVYKNP